MRADRRRVYRALAALGVTALFALIAFGPAQGAQASGATPEVQAVTRVSGAESYVSLNGAGSTYAALALNQYASAVDQNGLTVNFNPVGSADGREEWLNNGVDFAGTDIAFLFKGDPDPFGGIDAPSSPYAYSYIPDVAGGLAFLYNLQVDGHKITNLRLSGQVLAEIFTGHITNWDNPQITASYGAQLPNLPITVVTRSDGAGESYFLSNWIDTVDPSLWQNFCKAMGGPSDCGPTELYPGTQAGFTSKDGADLVTSYIGSSSNNGAIGYAEYDYALQAQIPVVQMLNAAGYYVGPTAANVAIALQAAKINEDPSSVDYLMQNLDNVYTDKDPRTYPLSSYSYMVVPRTSRDGLGPPPEFSTAKGQSLSTFVNYYLCQGQATIGDYGYSPLPEPMVVGGFLQDGYIPGAVKSEAASHYSSCENPAYYDGKDVLTATAPYPNACQKVGSPLDCKVEGGKAVNTAASGGSGSGSSGPGGTGSGTTGAGKTGAGKTTASAAASSGTQINPNTGQVEGAGTTGANADVQAEPVGLAGSPSSQLTFGVMTGLELLAAVAVPAGLGTWLQRRRRRPPAPSARPPAPGTPPPGFVDSPPAGPNPPVQNGDAG